MPSKSSICVFQCFPKLSWICWATWKWHYPYHGDHSNQKEHHQCPHDPYTHDKGSNHCSCHRHCLWVAGVGQEDTWDHVGENHTGDDHAQTKPVCQSRNWCGYYCWYYPQCCCPHFRSPRYSHCWRSWLRNTRNERHKRVESWSPKCWLWMSAVHMLISVITDEKSPPNEPYDHFFRELVPKPQFDFFTVGRNNHLCWNGLNGPSTNNHIYTLTNITLQISVCGGVLVTITVCTLEFRGNQYEPVLVSFANLNLQVLLNVSNNYAPEQSWAALGRQWSTVTETLPVDDTSSSMPQDNLSHAPYLSNVGRLSSLSSIANPPPQTKSMPTWFHFTLQDLKSYPWLSSTAYNSKAPAATGMSQSGRPPGGWKCPLAFRLSHVY